MSSLRGYANALSGASTTVLGAQRAADIVAAMTPPSSASSSPVAAAPVPSVKDQLVNMAPGLAGAAAGAFLWKRHRVLGALGGHAAVQAGYDYYRGHKKEAACNLAVEGAGIAGSLYFKKHPVLGWLGGVVAGGVATYFVAGSPVRNAVQKMK